MTQQPYTVVDAFTERPFAGNPAAVLVLDAPGDEEWMQLLAREFNLSETAFTFPEGDGWRLRWFTPTVEVDACGHATLAAAHTLFERGLAELTVNFDTRSGRLVCRRDGEQVVMDWPTDPCDQPADETAIAQAIGVPVQAAGEGRHYLLAEVADAATVRKVEPDLAAVSALGSTGLIVTAAGDGTADVVSRMFAPQSGIPEDPVTGSAHCCLVTWWAPRVGDELTAEQLSARGGRVHVRLNGDRVELRGHAVTVARGQLVA
ncbi:MAG: PhzF family phenazine biosynthesis isomerase [Streptosporangiales bacterium]|nr:PhzF family phenazine biosynthesis isomerase [Streptosporangiales bacterium]